MVGRITNLPMGDMKKIIRYILLLTITLFSYSANAQIDYPNDDMADKELQILNCLQSLDADYNAEYEVQQFGLPTPDTLDLVNEYGSSLKVLELCPAMPIGVVLCLSGIDSPSVTAHYGHAMEFYRLGYSTIIMDVSTHVKANSRPYEEVKDVQAVTDYIKSKVEYTNLPIIGMGVAMGGTVAMRSMIANYDINAVISISAFSSFEDYFAFNQNEADPAYDIPNISPMDVMDMSEADSIKMADICHVSGIDHRPVLLMHSTRDKLVPYSYFSHLLNEVKKNTNQLDSYVVPGDEHYICRDFLNPASDKDYFKVLTNFLMRLTNHIPTLAFRKLEDAQAI